MNEGEEERGKIRKNTLLLKMPGKDRKLPFFFTRRKKKTFFITKNGWPKKLKNFKERPEKGLTKKNQLNWSLNAPPF